VTLKKFCANCVMVAGAVSALSGAVKSVAEIFPTSCAKQAEVRRLEVPLPPPPPAPAPADEGEVRTRSRTLESRPEPPPKIVYQREEPKRTVWIWPALLVGGVALMAFARKLKRGEKTV
jgi:hypothetical protein